MELIITLDNGMIIHLEYETLDKIVVRLYDGVEFIGKSIEPINEFRRGVGLLIGERLD